MHTTIRRSLAITLVIVPVLAGAQPGAKPADSQEMIPRELAVALLSFSPGMSPEDIRVGKAPENIPPELVPPGLEVLGSMTQFENSIIVFAAPQPPDSAIAVMEARLLGMGWTKPPAAPAGPGRMRGGFVAAAGFGGAAMGGGADIICRGDEFATFTSTYRRSGGSIVKVAYNRGARFSACKVQQDTYRSPYEDAPTPTLRAPDGSMTTGGGGMSSNGPNSITLGTRLSIRLKPAEVVAHYDKQMLAAGWMSVSDGAADLLAVRNYRKKDEKDRTWTATLYSLSVPDTMEQDVSLRLTRR